jgi:uncharacterized protein (DUF433 family)
MTPRSEVVRDPTIMSGDPTVQGTRILAETILAYLRSNAPEEEIRKDYPSLPADGIEAVARWAEVTYGEDWKSAPALRFSLEKLRARSRSGRKRRRIRLPTIAFRRARRRALRAPTADRLQCLTRSLKFTSF